MSVYFCIVRRFIGAGVQQPADTSSGGNDRNQRDAQHLPSLPGRIGWRIGVMSTFLILFLIIYLLRWHLYRLCRHN
jgi:hypothetical protein